ncbi:MAG: tRNA lysidine(34) synthetase TilS, partial [Clostridia bacterium]|nr:tRNA lysidine(34) synthetase TilS [Clostridia bacterium]
LRHTVLPQLLSLNPNTEDAILRFSENARRDDEALYAIAESYRSVTDTKTLASLPFAVISRVLLIKYREKAHNEISHGLIQLAVQKLHLAQNGQFSGDLAFPGDVFLSLDRKTTVFLSDEDRACPLTETFTLSENTDTVFASRFRVVVTAEVSPPDHALFSFSVPKAKLSQITVRSRCEGDTYRSGSMTRNIKKMLCDKKVPRHLRNALPFFLYRDRILFIPYLPYSDILTAWAHSDNDTCRISILPLS